MEKSSKTGPNGRRNDVNFEISCWDEERIEKKLKEKGTGSKKDIGNMERPSRWMGDGTSAIAEVLKKGGLG